MMTNRQLFQQFLAHTSPFPLALEIEKAEGVWLYGKDKKYLDLISGIGVSNVGHRHPKVVEAIKNQADKYLHLMVYGEYIQFPQVELAQLLAKSTDYKLDSVYLVNSGTEATEGALKLAKRHTGRSQLISARLAYHGATHGALSLSDSEQFTKSFAPLLPDVDFIEFNNLLDLEKITEKTAAVMVETIQGEAGVIVPKGDYLKHLKNRCLETGTLLILDEVQCGAGRTGTFWAYQQYDIVPDILTSAKGMGGGMPIGAFLAPQSIMKKLTFEPILGHITTFGGHPVSAAAAAECVKLLLDERCLKDVEVKGLRFENQLRHTSIKSIRRKGLMMAVELDNFENLFKVINYCIENEVITDWFLFNDKSMRIAPPLTISFEEIDFACSIVMRALDFVYQDKN